MLTIQAEGTEKLVLYERGELECAQAWKTLIDVGKNPDEWMYMCTREVPGLRFHSFKNIDRRNYVRVVQVVD